MQDEGSQIVADLVMPAEGDQVLDYCAGGGGKTLAMAAAMNNKGQVHAYDSDRKRLAPIIERLKRAGTRNVQVHDDKTRLARAHRSLRQGSGRCALHRHRHMAPSPGYQVAADAEEPRRADRPAAGRAVAGSRLSSDPAACSSTSPARCLPEENEAQVAALHHRQSANSKSSSALSSWDTLFGADAPQPRSSDGKTITLTPASTDTDGFFFCRMRRKSETPELQMRRPQRILLSRRDRMVQDGDGDQASAPTSDDNEKQVAADRCEAKATSGTAPAGGWVTRSNQHGCDRQAHRDGRRPPEAGKQRPWRGCR